MGIMTKCERGKGERCFLDTFCSFLENLNYSETGVLGKDSHSCSMSSAFTDCMYRFLSCDALLFTVMSDETALNMSFQKSSGGSGELTWISGASHSWGKGALRVVTLLVWNGRIEMEPEWVWIWSFFTAESNISLTCWVQLKTLVSPQHILVFGRNYNFQIFLFHLNSLLPNHQEMEHFLLLQNLGYLSFFLLFRNWL